MNIQKKVEVYLDKKRNTRQIDVVQGDKGIQLVFSLMDFSAPDGTTATLYVQKPSGKFVYQEENITVSSDTVTVNLENQAITEYGKVYYQLALINGADEITTFASIMMVEKKYADSGAEESKTVISSFKQLTAEQIAQIKAATQTQIAELQTESARQQEKIEGKANTVLATIPEDYTATYNMAVEALRTKAPVIVQKATGSQILIKDGAEMPFQNFTSYGASEQKATKGYQLFDASRLKTLSAYGATITNNNDGSFTVSGSGILTNAVHLYTDYSHEETLQLLKVGTLKFDLGGTPTTPYFYIQLRSGSTAYFQINGNEISTSKEITQEMLDDENVNLRIGFYGASTGVTIVGGTIKPMLYQDGDGTWEEFSGATASPNPDYPQEINSVGDKGYSDGKLLNGVYNNATGAFTSLVFYVCSKNPVPCKEGDSINVKYGAVANAISIVYYDIDMNQVNYVAIANVSEIAHTAPANASYFHYSINENGLALTPSTAKKIVVTINGMYALIVKNGNKNLLPYPYNETTTTKKGVVCTDNGDGTVTFSGTATELVVFNLLLHNQHNKFETNKSYIVSGATDKVWLQVYESHNGVWQSARASTMSSAEFAFTEECDGYLVRAYIVAGTTVNDTIYPMIRPSGTDDTYVPHESQTTYIPIAEPLRGIGEVKDEVVKQDGVWGVLRRIAERTFDDTANWLVNGSYANTYYVGANIGLKANSLVGLSSHYIYKYTSSQVNNFDYCMFIGSYINFKNADISSLDDWKVWVAENPITVQYELATKVFTPFEDQTPFYQMKTFDGVTLVSASDDAEMEVEYATDTKRYIDNKIAELSAAILSN